MVSADFITMVARRRLGTVSSHLAFPNIRPSSMVMSFARKLGLSFFLLHSVIGATNAGRHIYSDSFPSEAEYDPSILDPHHVYGSPYGGFSRATRNRLASLPLHLPEISEEESSDNSNPMFFEVRDHTGRLFACRVYHEDELLPESLSDSMFDAPKLRVVADDSSGLVKDTNDKSTQHASHAAVNQHTRAVSQTSEADAESNPNPLEAATSKDSGQSYAQSPTGSSHGVGDRSSLVSSSAASKNAASVTVADDGEIASDALSKPLYETIEEALRKQAVNLLVVEKRLSELKAICGQIHKGWWSYEWCFEQSITQFHIEYDAVKNQVQVEGVTDLGTFKSRSVQFDLMDLPPNEWSEDTPEIARVVDIHEGGGICEETGNSRKTHVHLQCCSEKVIQRRKGMLHREGHQIASADAAVLDVHEDPDLVCTYTVTVCTPLLCGAIDDDDDVAGAGTTSISRMAATAVETFFEPASSKENESIREILDRTLSKLCLQTNTGGWWTYEFCHKQGIRQFHEATVTRRNSAGAKVTSKVIESEHVLGNYDAAFDKAIADLEDWELVVNVTSVSGGKTWGEGNGAYYEVEYTGGDVCDHSDVTDAAIVAGSTGSGDGVERASAVEFYCGQAYDVSVNEDSTCHYVVQVKVPALCIHPLFRAPVAKKQVMKCLPVDD